MSKLGVKETREALVAINELSIHLIEIFKKGLNLGTAIELWKLIETDTDLKNKVAVAYENYQLIPDELSMLDIAGVIELTYTQVAYVPAIIGALRRQESLPAPSPESISE